jgi:hypothetical protein
VQRQATGTPPIPLPRWRLQLCSPDRHRPPRHTTTLLAEAPELYYVTDHYLGYDAVLVRLERLNRELLHDLLAMAHRFVTRKGAKRA